MCTYVCVHVCVSSQLKHIEYQNPHSVSKLGPYLQSGAVVLGPTTLKDCVGVSPHKDRNVRMRVSHGQPNSSLVKGDYFG